MKALIRTLRDPWGNGNNRPDNVEKSFDQAQKILKGMFGNGNGGPNGQGNSTLIKGLFLILLGMWLFTGVYRVDDQNGEQAVILRFGKFVRVESAGLRFHLPYPIESHMIKRVSKARTFNIGRSNTESIQRIQNSSKLKVFQVKLGSGGRPVDSDQTFMLSSDFNIVNVSASVLWSINNLRDYLFNAKNPDDTLELVAEAVLREVIAKNTMEKAFTKGKIAIQQEVMSSLQDIVDQYKLGIIIRRVELQEVAEPLPVRNAFLDVERARQDKAKKKNDAEAYHDSVLPVARGQSEQIINQAKAYRRETIERSMGRSKRFLQLLKEYKSAPLAVQKITKNRLQMEAVEEILENAQKIVVDNKSAHGVLPYLPLKQFNDDK